MTKTILIFLFSLSFIYSATIDGVILTEEGLQPIVGARVSLANPNIITSDIEGAFKISNLPAGSYSLNITYFGYKNKIIQVNIKDTSEVIHLEIKLSLDPNAPVWETNWHSLLIDSISAIEDYHRYLQKFKAEHILKITLDSLKLADYANYVLKVNSTFHNEADTPIYVIAHIMTEAIIYNSSGQIIKYNVQYYHRGERTPDSSDFLRIDPHSSIKYPPVWLDLYAFDKFPPDIYIIKLKFTNKKRKSFVVGDWYSNRDYTKQKYYFNMALRGDYISADSLLYNNSKISKMNSQPIPLNKRSFENLIIQKK